MVDSLSSELEHSLELETDQNLETLQIGLSKDVIYELDDRLDTLLDHIEAIGLNQPLEAIASANAVIQSVRENPLLFSTAIISKQLGKQFEQQIAHPISNQTGRNDFDNLIKGFSKSTGLTQALRGRNTQLPALKDDPRLDATLELVSISLNNANLTALKSIDPTKAATIKDIQKYDPTDPPPPAPTLENRNPKAPYLGFSNTLTFYTQDMADLNSVRQMLTDAEGFPQIEFYPLVDTFLDRKGADAFFRVSLGGEYGVFYETLDFTLNAEKWNEGHKADLIISPTVGKTPENWDASAALEAAKVTLKLVYEVNKGFEISEQQLNSVISELKDYYCDNFPKYDADMIENYFRAAYTGFESE